MKALIIGISNSLSHELNVRDSFLTYAPAGWDAEILMLTTSSTVANNQYVVDTINHDPKGWFFPSDTQKIINWIQPRVGEYPIIVFSYYQVAQGYFDYLATYFNTMVFMPVTAYYEKTNVTLVGVGDSQHEMDQAHGIECYFKADLLPESRQLVPSYVTPAVAGIVAHSFDAGNDAVKSQQILRKNLNPVYDTRNGFGRCPSVLTLFDTVPAAEPPNYMKVDFSAGVIEYSIFRREIPQTTRVYWNDELIYNGAIGVGRAGSPAFSDSHILYFDIPFQNLNTSFTESDENTTGDFKVTIVINGEESPVQLFNSYPVTLTQTILESYFGVTFTTPDPEPEPIPDPEPEPEPIPEPGPTAQPPVLVGDIAPNVVKEGIVVTISAPVFSETVQLYRKERATDEWELRGIGTGQTIIDTVDEAKNYMYAITIGNSGGFSELSAPAYIAGEEIKTLAPGYF
jgi:hypothetical protein